MATILKKTEGNVLTIKTIQIAAFKTLITALKEILSETNITFDSNGIRIINMDKSHTILAYLKLYASNFEFFECKKEKIIIGVDMMHLFTIINTIDNGDTLIISIDNNDYVDGIVSYLTITFENNDKKQCKEHKLKLIEPDHEELVYPDVYFSSIINLPSSDFQKIIRDLSTFKSDKVEIKSVGNELIFKCSGAFVDVVLTRGESNELGFLLKQDSNKIMHGEYSLKILNYFTKCTNLCPQIELFLENDLPLIVKYKIASLGSIRLCLSSLPSN